MSKPQTALGAPLPPLQGEATQVAALCLDRALRQVLLITSRGTKRWILPKGWPMPDRSPAGAALREAWEEAGVEGIAGEAELGRYHYRKQRGGARGTLIEVRVYPVVVTRLTESYREAGQRRLGWFSPEEAAARVAEPELQALILALPQHRAAGLIPQGG